MQWGNLFSGLVSIRAYFSVSRRTETMRYILIALLLLSSPVLAQEIITSVQGCMDRQEAIKNLKEDFSEHRMGLGIDPSVNVVFEIFASKEGTWTIIITFPNGRSCQIASGEGWTVTKRALGT